MASGLPNNIEGKFYRDGTEVTPTPTQLNYLSSLTATPINKVAVQVITSTSTYTPTAGLVYCIVEGVGAGGGGGGAATSGAGQFAHGGGGGYGGYFRKLFTAAELGVDAAVTIGAAGAAGAAGNNAGSVGGDTIFNPAGTGATLTGVGGSGGGGCPLQASANIYDAGGAGGTATNGDLNIQGAYGGYGLNLGANQGFGGGGGNGIWGVGGRGSVNAAGIVGTGYGSGGAGGATANSAQTAGSAGTIGLVVVTEFLSA